MDLCRKIFEYVVCLLLYWVHEMKSGGVVSVLWEDVGGIVDLIFSMIYNLWCVVI